MKSINTKDFKLEIATGATFVAFSATWCAPCKTLEPVLLELEKEYAGKLNFCKVDITENPDLAVEWLITSVPTLFLFKKGEVCRQIKGAATKATIKKMLTEML